ncbi:TatD family hydrolase [Bacillus horti]|uniref:TatD DNase family protein n=1 Tax=Caldalkalibacillus horti TaxID=77523 RepID=A0ABT9VYR5_9BACI|nr:TatD family hydrolase [Bacillus horti]MDQ0166010.1 TatD DNase family protein [Bacillus horti]
MIDAHIHLDLYHKESLDEQIEEWKMGGCQAVIAVSNDLASSYRSLELQARYPDFVFAAVGFHPEYPLPSEAEFLEWQSLVTVEKARITAIGEIGLPHYELDKLPHSLDKYIDFLSRCLQVAQLNQLPVALHAVHDKAKIVLDLLQQLGIKQAHFHWLKAPKDVVLEIVGAGYFISVTPEICYRERDQRLAELVPLRQLLVETDGPWSYKAPFEGQRTSPLMIERAIQKVAEVKGISIDLVRNQLVMNTRGCYHLII